MASVHVITWVTRQWQVDSGSRRRSHTDSVIDANGSERLRLAFDLYRMGEQMQRARFAARSPGARRKRSKKR